MHNVSDGRKRIYTNKNRIIGAVPYIEQLYIYGKREAYVPIFLLKIND